MTEEADDVEDCNLREEAGDIGGGGDLRDGGGETGGGETGGGETGGGGDLEEEDMGERIKERGGGGDR